jgi:hypothetical protein
MKTQYVCPIDKDFVLFEDEQYLTKMFVFDHPRTCPRCGKMYFKSECVPLLTRTQGYDDDET